MQKLYVYVIIRAILSYIMSTDVSLGRYKHSSNVYSHEFALSKLGKVVDYIKPIIYHVNNNKYKGVLCV